MQLFKIIFTNCRNFFSYYWHLLSMVVCFANFCNVQTWNGEIDKSYSNMALWYKILYPSHCFFSNKVSEGNPTPTPTEFIYIPNLLFMFIIFIFLWCYSNVYKWNIIHAETYRCISATHLVVLFLQALAICLPYLLLFMTLVSNPLDNFFAEF